ncbi:transglycosylase domain-containing protein [soil metagenome]
MPEAPRPARSGASNRATESSDLGWWRSRRAAKKRRLAKMSRKKRVGRRIGILATWLLGLLALLVTVAAIGVYKFVNVPSPDSLPQKQLATLTYSNGAPIASVGAENRISVPLSKVPDHVRNAVIAAEDRGFYSEPGISVRGTVRAVVNDLKGGQAQGGSTITQQYVKNAYLNSDQTLTRKLKEAAIALKLSREYSKDTILEYYLNTIYFGRNTYGIEAASQAYFGVDVSKLSVSQGALLAAVIKSPEYYDPRVTPAAAKDRWTYVVDGMVSTGKLTQAARDKLTFPTTIVPKKTSSALDGPLGLVWSQVKLELAADGINSAQINTRGLKIQTTIDQSAQAAAQSAISQTYSNLASFQKNLRPALTAVNPSNGAVLAYYGGSDGTGLDYAQAWRPPGSSFKPYVTATALSQNLAGKTPSYTIQSSFNGASPQDIAGQNFENDPTDPSSGTYTLTQATTLSLNTVFGKLTSLVGADNVAATAHAMGIPAVQSDTGPHPGAKTLIAKSGAPDDYVGIGNYPVRILDQADAYATLASGGIHRKAYFVQKVTDSGGSVLFQHKDAPNRVLDPKVANDTTLAMEQVAPTSGLALFDGRTVAAKTGTVGIQNSGNSSDGWTVGFTNAVSASSWVGSDKVEPIYDANHNSEYGRDLAGNAWKLFMNAYLQNKPAGQMPTTQQILKGTTVQPSATPTSSAPSTSAPTTSTPTTTAPVTTPPTSAPPTTTSAPPPPSTTTSPSCGLLGTPCPTTSAPPAPAASPNQTPVGG